eukprot:TRINITY_DN62067_c0_g1_i1.p1 TRINITY_DN62067_c0_g1~~TRINITY_DN62067_c0_g1_i1.p1  ORF type:complete len:543 (+),score=105.86 TRINITY_DN62067_c0_g1_i1:88-1716(+)
MVPQLAGLFLAWLPGLAAEACSEVSSLESCAKRPSCFPHFTEDRKSSSCVTAEEVDCRIDANAGQALALLVSDGLSCNDLRYAFRDLVLQLPDSAWDGSDGAKRKEEAAARSSTELLDADFKEPELYKGLTAVSISDACYLKQFEKDPWPCESFKPALLQFGFEAAKVKEVSLFSHFKAHLDNDAREEVKDLKSDLLKIWESTRSSSKAATGGVNKSVFKDFAAYVQKEDLRQTVDELLESVDVVVVSGGSPDFLTYAMMLCDYLKERLRTRVRDGKTIFMGRSAGAMIGGKDSELTTEMLPKMWETLGISRHGLGIAGDCTIRPHYTKTTWDRASAMYEQILGVQVVRVPNGEGLLCSGKDCKMVGMRHLVEWSSNKSAPPKITVDEQNTVPHREGGSDYSAHEPYELHGDDSFSQRFKHGLPTTLDLGSTNPECRLCVLQVLTGSIADTEHWNDMECDKSCASKTASGADASRLFAVSDLARGIRDVPREVSRSWVMPTALFASMFALIGFYVSYRSRRETSASYRAVGARAGEMTNSEA